MKSRVSVWLLYGILATIGVAGGALLAQGGQPELTAAQTTYDFGIVQPGGNMQHAFEIKNTGRQPLKISKINVSCGCIKDAHAEVDAVAPGASTKLLLTWEPPTFQKDVIETVDVETNDPVRPSVRFTIQAQVRPQFSVEPAVLNFGVLESSELPGKEVIAVEKSVAKVSSENAAASDTIKVSSNNNALQTTVAKKGDNQWEITVTLKKDVPLGPLDGTLIITPSWSGPRTVPLLGEVTGSVAADPGEIYLESEETKKGTETIQVAATEGEATVTNIRILSITPALQSYFKAVVNGSKIDVTYDLSGGASPRALKGRLLVEVQQGNVAKQLSIPITVAR
jgi:hypothetical protein